MSTLSRLSVEGRRAPHARSQRELGREPLSSHALILLLGALFGGGLVTLSAVHAPSLPIIALIASVGLYLLLKNPTLSLSLFALGVMLDDFYISAGFAEIGVGDLAILLIGMLWSLERLRTNISPRLPDGWPIFVSFMLFIVISWMLGVSPQSSRGLLVRFLIYLFAVLIVVDYIRALRQLHVIYISMIFAGVIQALSAFYLDNDNARLGGLADQANSLGALLGLTLSIALAYFKHYKLNVLQRALLLTSIFTILLALIFTISRGSYLAFGLTMLWLYQRYLRHLFTAAMLLIAALFIYDQLDPERFAFMLRRLEFNDTSVDNRWQVLLNALELIQERPWFGIGFGQFKFITEVIDVEAEAGRSPHTFYVGSVASTGVLGAGTMFVYVGYQALMLWREVGFLKTKINRDRATEAERRALLFGEVAQAMFVFQSVSLAVRGSKRFIEWLPITLISITYLYVRELRIGARDERGVVVDKEQR